MAKAWESVVVVPLVVPPRARLARRVGVAVKAIQAMLRHSSLAITADTYNSLFADDGHAAAE
jgi:hypothetical protein